MKTQKNSLCILIKKDAWHMKVLSCEISIYKNISVSTFRVLDNIQCEPGTVKLLIVVFCFPLQRIFPTTKCNGFTINIVNIYMYI